MIKRPPLKCLSLQLYEVEATHHHSHKQTKTKDGFANDTSLLKLLYAGDIEVLREVDASGAKLKPDAIPAEHPFPGQGRSICESMTYADTELCTVSCPINQLFRIFKPRFNFTFRVYFKSKRSPTPSSVRSHYIMQFKYKI